MFDINLTIIFNSNAISSWMAFLGFIKFLEAF